MSIDQAPTPSSSSRPGEGPQRSDNDRPAEARREAPPKEAVDRFRQLMQHGRQEEGRSGLQEKQERGLHGAGRAVADPAARQEGQDVALRGLRGQRGTQDGTDNNGMGANSLEASDVLAMMQAQAALRDGAAMAPTQAPAPMASSRSLADMLERHVRQLAVDAATATDGEGRVLLRMADATLPGTDLMLSKTADGWLLRADVRSRGSYDAIREAAPQLAQRFAEQNLGKLEIDPHFNG